MSCLVGIFITSLVTSVPQVRAGTSNNGTTTPSTSIENPVEVQTQQKEGQQALEETQVQQQQQQQSPNHRPIANAGADNIVNEGDNVILDATRSSDPDPGDQLTYLWRQVGGQLLVTLDNPTSTIASFTAPDLSRDTTFTFVVTIRDDRGAQDIDNVRVSIKNIDVQSVTNQKNNINNNNAPSSTNTNNNANTHPTGTAAELKNTTKAALTNAEKERNLNGNNNNASKTTGTATLAVNADAQARGAVFTPQAVSSGVLALQSNNIVNTRTAYDILFRTASAGVIKSVAMTFPQGTTLSSRVVEVSGVGHWLFRYKRPNINIHYSHSCKRHLQIPS